MRLKFKSLIFAFGILPLLVLQARAQEKLVVRVDGLSCAFCAYGLEKNLKELQGVERVEINVKDGTASLTVKGDKLINDEAIKKIVKDSGFTPREIKREQPAKEQTLQMETIKLNVTGMSCSGCVYNVKTALEEVPSVDEAEVDLKSGTALVKFAKGKVSASQLIQAIEKAGGYKATTTQQ